MCTIRDVKATLSMLRRAPGALITEARIAGEPVIITDYGKPVATLIPVPPPRIENDLD